VLLAAVGVVCRSELVREHANAALEVVKGLMGRHGVINHPALCDFSRSGVGNHFQTPLDRPDTRDPPSKLPHCHRGGGIQSGTVRRGVSMPIAPLEQPLSPQKLNSIPRGLVIDAPACRIT
jgi:hypothetical protein